MDFRESLYNMLQAVKGLGSISYHFIRPCFLRINTTKGLNPPQA